MTRLTALQGGWLDPIMRVASEFGGGVGLSFFTAVALGLLVAIRQLRSAAFVAITFVAADIGSGAFKALVGRPRPPLEFRTAMELPGWTEVVWLGLAAVLVVVLWRTAWRRVALLAATMLVIAVVVDRSLDQNLFTPGLDSFPSGHAMRSTGLAASLVLVAWAHPRRPMLLALAAASVLLIGLSRVYLGVHYPTDVLAGWLAALAVVLGVSLIPPLDPTRQPPSLSLRPKSGEVGTAERAT